MTLFAAALCLVAAFLAFPPLAAATQSCPEGQIFAARPYLGPDGTLQQNAGCYPDGTSQPTKWEDRWGAFAMASDGSWGGVLDMPSKEIALEAALSECKADGGQNCTVDLIFYNQCAAVFSGGRTAGSTGMARAPTLQEAVQAAKEKCGNENCESFFQGCSLAVRVK